MIPSNKRPLITPWIRIRWQHLMDLTIKEMKVKDAFVMQKVEDDLMQVCIASRTDENPYIPGHHFKISGTFSELLLDKNDYLLIEDATKDFRISNSPAVRIGYTYYQGLSIKWPDGEIFGTLLVLDKENNANATEEKELLEEFKVMVEQDLIVLDQQEKLAIEKNLRKVAEDELKHFSPKEFNSLWEAAKAILVHRKFEDSARVIFDEVCKMTGATAGYVALLSEDGSENEVLFLEAGGLPCTVNPSLPMPIRGLRAESYNSHKAVYDNDFMRSKWTEYLPEGHVNLKNVMFSPLNIDNATVGIIGIANKDGDFTDYDATVAEAFGDLAAIALKNARMVDELAVTDKRLESFNENLVERELRIIDVKREVNELCRSLGQEVRYKEIDDA